MNRWNVSAAVGTVLSLGVGVAPATAQHEHGNLEHGNRKAAPVLPECPVMGEPIDFGVSIAGDDGPVFFCCKKCIAKYQANPARYTTDVVAQRKALARIRKVQATCPVSRKPVDRRIFAESDGRKVYFCSKGCVRKFQRESDKYKAALANSYTYQTTCPVSGEDIDPSAFKTAANGMNIYFCCDRCEKKFFANPAKYVPKLVAQGFSAKPGELTHKETRDERHRGNHDSHGGHNHDHDH